MGLRLADSWVWDCWFTHDGVYHHVFYLRASRELGDPELRHHNTFIGHSRSRDLCTWETLPDALVPSMAPAFDDWTTWTGSVVRDNTGLWHMFYTGRTHADDGHIQRVVHATSSDLMKWTKTPNWALEADETWYEVLSDHVWTDVTWRDPWVFRHHDGQWQMFLTARHDTGDSHNRGTIGLATSPDLRNWTIQPPTARPAGFAQLEVLQSEVVDNVPVLLWCVGFNELSSPLQEKFGAGGVFSCSGDSLVGPFAFESASRFPHESLYAARLVQHEEQWFLIGFKNYEHGQFVGELCDPIRVTAQKNVGVIPLN